MNLFILVMINIFMGVALYLIISLKLERSASDFRQNRLRKEMDDMIREFNSTAERNISLLEHKINVMKKLLDKTGRLDEIDITVGDDHKEDEAVKPAAEQLPGNEKAYYAAENNIHKLNEMDWASVRREASSKKSLPILADAIINKITTKKNWLAGAFLAMKTQVLAKTNQTAAAEDVRDDADEQSPQPLRVSIEKNLADIDIPEGLMRRDEPAAAADEDPFSDDRMEELFSGTEDIYKLVVHLSADGCPLEKISRFSGMPAGEIKLILNLQRP